MTDAGQTFVTRATKGKTVRRSDEVSSIIIVLRRPTACGGRVDDVRPYRAIGPLTRDVLEPTNARSIFLYATR
jgi:hypothetical protein